jgi:N-acetylglucosamine-6-sulfatase
MKAITSLLLGIATVAAALVQQPLNDKTRPNIVFILTDDQDKHLDSLKYMPLLQRYITDKGTVFNRHYCTTAVCCPSRVSLWTGRNAHNTNVTDVFPPYGGYPKFVAQGFNSAYLPIWLQDAGYNTFYTGKLFNSHTVLNYHSPFPAGWTTSDFLLDPFTYQYLNATTQRNRDPPVSWEGHYSTDVLAAKAYGLLEDAITLKTPFFLTVATNAPHSNVAAAGIHEGMPIKDVLAAIRMTAPIPADRHKHLFPDVRVPRTANFNPAEQHKVSWLKNLARLNDTVIQYNDYFYRQRLRALQAVDEIVEGLVTRLEDAGILENTYVVYSTDNGFHISQHRLNPGKECGFEEDINIPLIIRGPGVPVGETDVVTAHTDLAPTFLKIAGVEPRGDFDGTAIPLDAEELRDAVRMRQEHVNVEFWGRSLPEGTYGFSLDDGTFGEHSVMTPWRST